MTCRQSLVKPHEDIMVGRCGLLPDWGPAPSDGLSDPYRYCATICRPIRPECPSYHAVSVEARSLLAPAAADAVAIRRCRLCPLRGIAYCTTWRTDRSSPSIPRVCPTP